MFNGAEAFNNGGSSTIGNWNTSLVNNMASMFQNAKVFNQNIGYSSSVSTTAWDTSKVTNMSFMFNGASAFNNNGSSTIGNWITLNVTTMSNMFNGATVFYQNISGWTVTKVITKPPANFSTGSALATNSAYIPTW
jgi:surface protein